MKLAMHLKNLLKEKDVTVAQLSRAAKVPAKTIYSWLSGNNPRSLSDLKSVANHLGVTLDFLCFNESTKATKDPIHQYGEEINAGYFEVVLRRRSK
jgi:transcriptional regulator with XRE-family HTH domain